MKYGEKKSLPMHSPYDTRMHIFKENLVDIFHHNLNTRMRMHSTYEMGINNFADMVSRTRHTFINIDYVL